MESPLVRLLDGKASVFLVAAISIKMLTATSPKPNGQRLKKRIGLRLNVKKRLFTNRVIQSYRVILTLMSNEK